MKIVFFTNFINHHQVHVADELYRTLGDDYTFVATTPLPESFIKNGYPDYSTRPYLLKAYENEANDKKARELALTSDIVILGAAPLEYILPRIKQNKITFRYSERWFRKGVGMLLNPKRLYNIFKSHTIFRNKPLYMLCASAFMPNDAAKVFAYPDKCYKWGYFTAVPEAIDRETSDFKTSALNTLVRIMWCARFLKLKHPELAVQMASILKAKGYDFQLDMYGSGPEEEPTRQLIQELNVGDIVKMHGALPNEQILQAMRKHHIFLFTSDKNEGWGAVANEAMSNGCVLVGSNEIGSIPFLVKDGENGCVFKSKDAESLTKKVEWLINNPKERERLAANGFRTIKDVWSPQVAAKRLLELCDALIKNEKYVQESGPCSIATIYNPDTNI